MGLNSDKTSKVFFIFIFIKGGESTVIILCPSVRRITHERVYGCRPNLVGMDNGLLSRSG